MTFIASLKKVAWEKGVFISSNIASADIFSLKNLSIYKMQLGILHMTKSCVFLAASTQIIVKRFFYYLNR